MKAAAAQAPAAPELLEAPRAQPCEEGMDDTAEWSVSQPRNREPLEGGLWLPLEACHG